MSNKLFKLSCSLLGHALDVRCVTYTTDNCIISGSRDKTAKFWKPNGFNSGYYEALTYHDQQNFVASVLYMEYLDGLVITGGNDSVIHIYKVGEPFASFSINEHTNTVCCLSKGINPGTFLSSSWDFTAKLWNLNDVKKPLVTFDGHSATVWSVIQLSNSNVVTACADKTIGLWFKDGQRFQLITAHTDCVRDLEDFPEIGQFASVANDATIKFWNYSGENVDTLYGHTNYIYSIARNGSGGNNCFVTSDEDRSIKFWKDGQNTQTIQLPSQSVWSVCCLPNGDIVSGSSDGVIRVFTLDESRWASEDMLRIFEEEVVALQQQNSQEIGGYKVSDLPGREALYDPGKTPGQIKMIREPQGVIAYMWVEDGENSRWEKVGDVLGGADKSTEGKTMFEGQPYDFVFSVDVEDGKPPLKLPYNKGDDPYKAANLFLSRNILPAVYLDQVVDFILKNSGSSQPPINSDYVDPFTGASRYTPSSNMSGFGPSGSNVDPFTGQNSYSSSNVPSSSTKMVNTGVNADPYTGNSSYTSVSSKFFPIAEYRTFDMGDPEVILKKLKEFNQRTGDSSNRIDEKLLEDVVKLCKEATTEPKCYDALFRLLNWPEDIVFPVIDVIRLALKIEANNKVISLRNDGEVVSKIKQYINPKNKVQNIIVTMRAFSNFFCQPAGEDLMFKNRVEIIEDLLDNFAANKNIEVALATLLLNFSILTNKKQDEVGVYFLANLLPEVTVSFNDPEAQFRALVAIGTLVKSGPIASQIQVKENIKQNDKFKMKLKDLAQAGNTDIELKRKNCALQLEQEIIC